MRRSVLAALLAVGALLAGLLAGPGPAGAQADPAAVESAFVARINSLRATKGLAALDVHGELTRVARSWAAAMAEADQISHNPALQDQVQADWQKLGENVGVGMTVDSLHDAFVASPSHYKNLVDPAYQHVGVGVVYGRDGAIFTAHQFMRLRSAAPATTAAPTTAPPRPVATTARPAPAPAATAGPSPAPDRPAADGPARSAPDRAATDAEEPAAAPAPAPVPLPARLVLVLQQLGALDAA